MPKRKVDVDAAIRIIKDSIDGMDMDGFVLLVEHLMPCKNVIYLPETDEIEYELDEKMDYIDSFSECSTPSEDVSPEPQDLS